MLVKRTFDLVAAALLCLVFSPVLLLVAALIKIGSPGPVFYRGVRAGLGGRTFRIFKFRSMVVDAESRGGSSTADDDDRITGIGKLLRKYKLDELPQLLNVLAGDMSLVGPRPEVAAIVEKYGEEEKQTLSIRPGITDWASLWNSDEGGVLEGAPDPDAMYERVIQPTKLNLQLHYLNSRSMWGDLKIVFFTILRIAFKSWTPQELRSYPSFDELRAEVQRIVAEEAELASGVRSEG